MQLSSEVISIESGIITLSHMVRRLMESHVAVLVEGRAVEFSEMRQKSWKDWFSELAFCILTANSSAELGIKIQEELGPKGFLEFPLQELSKRLRQLGHRFPNARAKYIVDARVHAERLKEIVEGQHPYYAREWLARNIRGLGYKEASHFLRNTGHFGLAIIDRHIMRLLYKYGVIPLLPSSLSRKRYLEMEEHIMLLSNYTSLEPGILDLYLWYLSTGKVLK